MEIECLRGQILVNAMKITCKYLAIVTCNLPALVIFKHTDTCTDNMQVSSSDNKWVLIPGMD